MLYWQLFISFLKIGFIGFGGGMAIVSLIEGEVLRYGWATEQEFVDIVALSQVTPGPIGINCATYVGYTAGGVWGSLLASAAIVLPSLLIMGVLCYAYDRIHDRWQENRIFIWVMRGIRLMVVVLIAHAALMLMTPASFPDATSWVVFGVVLALCLGDVCIPAAAGSIRKRVLQALSHPIYIILAVAMIGYIDYLIHT